MTWLSVPSREQTLGAPWLAQTPKPDPLILTPAWQGACRGPDLAAA